MKTQLFSRQNPMKLLIALDSNGMAEGELFWDDGNSVGKLPCFFGYKTRVSTFQNNPKNLDPSYKLDLDFSGLFWQEKTHLTAELCVTYLYI